MRKASSRGFGFTAIAILVGLMALSAFLTKAEATPAHPHQVQQTE
ncbi:MULTISPECIES: hypothetical protein [Rheinheimera]|uniref:Uncharacterized protein n=1 Tax=Rheinheimera marina TaxID=1774958 RepID=A0ABV9JLJ8_9GAMM